MATGVFTSNTTNDRFTGHPPGAVMSELGGITKGSGI
jgi:hypothetical protein